MTPTRVLAILAVCISVAVVQQSKADTAAFAPLLRELWPLAEAQSISRATFDAAFAGVTPDPRILPITQRQPEYNRPVGGYINSVVSESRIAAGQRKAAQWDALLDRVEKTYNVDRFVLLAIWGIETSYGADPIRWDVMRSLATLVHIRYRAPYFRSELLAALKILQDKHIARDKFLGSWAGALGQPQFMPSTFLSTAVDFSGDGKRDIWTDVPDVLASIGNYLKIAGWQTGESWGFEVVVPANFAFDASRGAFSDWSARDFKRADGGALPLSGNAILFFPSGANGPAFLVTENFSVIKRYNNSDVYALAVAHLADRLHGGKSVRAPWPRVDPQLPREQRITLQRKLADLGYPVRDFEGRMDFDLRDMIREQQTKFGMRADGHPTAALLEKLGIAAPRP